MIKILDERVLRFVNFLNTNYGTDEEVCLSVLHGYDSVTADEEGANGFAVYLPPARVILLPSDVPKNIVELNDEELTRNFVISNLAHEYAHFLQDVGVLDGFDDENAIEDIAEDFAARAVAEFEQQEGGRECSPCLREPENAFKDKTSRKSNKEEHVCDIHFDDEDDEFEYEDAEDIG